MYEYLPWSRRVLEQAEKKYKIGYFSIIDAELGGMCNLNCIYCDSPDRNKYFSSIIQIKNMIQSEQFEWIFICGLGEPSFSDNKAKLIEILEYCKIYNVKCSIFTNLIDFDETLLKYVSDEILYIMFKLDSFKEDKLKIIYGSETIDFKNVIQKIYNIVSVVKVKDNCTNLCASIVPTTLNYDELPEIIDFCLDNNIFPLIGDLEDSGKGQEVYQQLKLTDNQLKKIKKLFDYYKIPICPSVLYGIHILYNGKIAVDESTGLSCHWFWLSEPNVKILGNIKDFSDISNIEKSILEYRLTKLNFVKEQVSQIPELVFGGCGGDIKYLLQKYLTLYE